MADLLRSLLRGEITESEYVARFKASVRHYRGHERPESAEALSEVGIEPDRGPYQQRQRVIGWGRRIFDRRVRV